MKKILIGIVIGFVVIIGGCAALVGAGVSSVDDAVKEVQQQTVEEDKKVQEMAKDIQWEVKKGEFSTTIVGVFENTGDEILDYVEFDYKLIDGQGTVIENSFTNETDINPGEKRKIEIMCIEKDFEKYEIAVKSSVL